FGHFSPSRSMTTWLIPNGHFMANTVLSFSAVTSTLSSFRLVVILNLSDPSLGAALSPATAVPLRTRRATRGTTLAFMLRLRPGPSLESTRRRASGQYGQGALHP